MVALSIHARDARPGGVGKIDTPPKTPWTGWTVGHRFALLRFSPSKPRFGGLDKLGGLDKTDHLQRTTHANNSGSVHGGSR